MGGNNIHKNILTVVGISILFLGLCITPTVATDNFKEFHTPISDGNTLYVGGSGEGNYTKIQDAIDNAIHGDTVFVFDDSSPYNENPVVDKSISLIGEDKYETIIDGGSIWPPKATVSISSDEVNINGFTIQNGHDGIYIDSNYKNNIICKNIISANRDFGINLYYSIYNSITGNIINYNREDGIYLCCTSGNTINDNTIRWNSEYGIKLYKSYSNTISCNKIYENRVGIEIVSSNGNTIKFNSILNNGDWFDDYGLYLLGSHDNTILRNTFINNVITNARALHCSNFWLLNYWNRPRILPKIIYQDNYYSNIDWRPALLPIKF